MTDTKQPYREDVLKARETWADFLMRPGRKQAFHALDRGNGERCCLGHACYALKIKRRKSSGGCGYAYGNSGEYGLAPRELVHMVGLHNAEGLFAYGSGSLAGKNDAEKWPPKKIGEFLKARLDGTAPDSPWKPLSDYEARPSDG